MTHLLCCPACGPFGIRARRRNRRAADAALVRFWAQLAAEVRAERRQPRATFYDSRFRRVAGPMPARELTELRITVVSA